MSVTPERLLVPGDEFSQVLQVLGLVEQVFLDLLTEKSHGLAEEGLGFGQFPLPLEEGGHHEEVVLLAGVPPDFLWNLFPREGAVAILQDLGETLVCVVVLGGSPAGRVGVVGRDGGGGAGGFLLAGSSRGWGVLGGFDVEEGDVVAYEFYADGLIVRQGYVLTLAMLDAEARRAMSADCVVEGDAVHLI